MTNLEALKANIADAHGLQFTENHFVKALTDKGLVDSETYQGGNEKTIDLATVALYDKGLGSASFREGDLSYTADSEAIKTAIDAIYLKWNMPTRYGKQKAKISSIAAW